MAAEFADAAACRAALYIRLSREDDSDGPSQSVTNQQSLLREFVRQQGFAVYDIYIDDGYSGASFDRPAFQRMLADIEAKRVNTVITKDLSRLGRDYILTGHYMERYFPEHRVRYISLLDGIDTGVESSANDITPFRAIMNDMYAKDISKKIRSVKHDKQRKGQFIGGKPVYGYRMHPTEKNRIVIDEAAAQIVRRIFAMALDGRSCRGIAAALNAERVPPPAVYAGLPLASSYSGLWSGERISELLQNETYLGNMVQGRTVKPSYKSRKSLRQPRERWIVIEGTHEPLVDRESFRQVALLLLSRRQTRSRRYDAPLKGLIFCGACGHPLSLINRKNAAGADVLYFTCRSRACAARTDARACRSILEQAVSEAVAEALHRHCEPHLQPSRLLELAEEISSQLEGRTKSDLPALQRRIDALTADLDRVYLDRLGGLLSEPDFGRIYARIRASRSSLEMQRDALGQQSPSGSADAARDAAAQFLESTFTRRTMLCNLIERIEWNADRTLEIRFRFREPDAPL